MHEASNYNPGTIFSMHFDKSGAYSQKYSDFFLLYMRPLEWLRYCATNRKVTGSIPDGVIGIFH
jgi:hypothetical protein